jgi:hypothetical protein
VTSEHPEAIETPDGVTLREHGLGRGTVVRVEATGLDEWSVDAGDGDEPAEVALDHGLAWIGVPPGGQPVVVRRGRCTVRATEGRLVVEAGPTGETLVLVVSGSASVAEPGGETELAPSTAVVLDEAGELVSIDTVAADELADDTWVTANTDRDASGPGPEPGGEVVEEVAPGDEVVPADEPEPTEEPEPVEEQAEPVEDLAGPDTTTEAAETLTDETPDGGQDLPAGGPDADAVTAAEPEPDDGEATAEEPEPAEEAVAGPIDGDDGGLTDEEDATGWGDDGSPDLAAPDLAAEEDVEAVADEVPAGDQDGGAVGADERAPAAPLSDVGLSSSRPATGSHSVLTGRDPLPDRRGESRPPMPVPNSDFVGVAVDEGGPYAAPEAVPSDDAGWEPPGRLLAWLVLAVVVALLFAGAIFLSRRDDTPADSARLAEAQSETAPEGSTAGPSTTAAAPATTTEPSTTEPSTTEPSTTEPSTTTAPPEPSAELVECRDLGNVVVASGTVTGALPVATYRVRVEVTASDGQSFGEAVAEAPVQPDGRTSLWSIEVPLTADITGTDAGCEIRGVTTGE